MTALLLQSFVLVAASVIVFRAEPALNLMSPCTPFMIRASFHLLTLGAVAEIVFVLVGDVPSWPASIMTVGVALLVICEKRLRILCPMPRRTSQ